MKRKRAPAARSKPTGARRAPRARPSGGGGIPRSVAELRRLLARHAPVWHRRLGANPADGEWLFEGAPLERPRTLASLDAAWRAERGGEPGFEATFSALREVKRREMLRITARDLAGCAPLEETVAELSSLADFCLRRGLACCAAELSARHGEPSTGFGVFGMGKLGGQELNYSSDIDLIFAYGEEGSVGPLTHHDFFTRLANRLLQGFRGGAGTDALFRVDLRLRPENKSGPIVRSLESYENYYAGFGETWERMALQKCRMSAGDGELGYEFIQRLQPFCFPRYLPPQALDEIFGIKSRIEAEILREGGLERHVKLGKGGIREIEFSVQALQLIHGARHAFSQESGTLKSIQALHRLELVSAPDALALTRAYIFFRRVEHRLQMREDRQTHTIPESKAEQARLAEGLGYASLAAFEKEWAEHRAFVRQFFQSIVRPNIPGEEGAGRGADAWDADADTRARRVGAAGFADPARAQRAFEALASGPEYAHVSQRTRGFFTRIREQILALSPSLARPDHALIQFERFIEGYGSRATLYELLASNPKVVDMLFQLFDHSQFLTEVVVRQPGILESIAYEGLMSIRRDRAGMDAALAREAPDGGEAALREFQRSELVRIELRDILGVAESLEETFEQLTLLADVCVARALEAATAAAGGAKPAPMAVIALGKFGGRDLSYGADLDVLFVGGTSALAAKLIGLLGRDTGDGALFKVDARLRPDGDDGPLAIPMEAFARYYRTRAQFWERQSLTRARPVAGDAKLGRAFLKLVDEVIYARPVSREELGELAAMRRRIEKERGDSSDPARDFKTGAGGMVEVEFLAQALQLRHGSKHAALRRASTLEVLRAMPRVAGWAGADAERIVGDYLWLRGLESAARRFHNAPVWQLPKERDEWAPVARHVGLGGVAALEKELAERRARLRALVSKLAPKA